MNINDMTIGEFKELQELFGGGDKPNSHGAIGRYCVIRTYSSGVHIGVVKQVSPNGGRSRAMIENARRIYDWKGKFTISAIANSGVGEGSRLSEVVGTIYLENCIEFIPCTVDAEKALKEYKDHDIKS